MLDNQLEIWVRSDGEWNEDTEEFADEYPPTKLVLMHSLISLSKWESKWHLAYLSTDLNLEQLVDYVRCMTVNSVPEKAYDYLSGKNLNDVADYTNDQMTATRFTVDSLHGGNSRGSINGRIITSELLYYYMFTYNIPKDCEKWHLNRLITLIRIFGEENKPKKKIPTSQLISDYAKLNAQRRAQWGTRG